VTEAPAGTTVNCSVCDCVMAALWGDSESEPLEPTLPVTDPIPLLPPPQDANSSIAIGSPRPKNLARFIYADG
jgi:hypothetical protein